MRSACGCACAAASRWRRSVSNQAAKGAALAGGGVAAASSAGCSARASSVSLSGKCLKSVRSVTFAARAISAVRVPA